MTPRPPRASAASPKETPKRPSERGGIRAASSSSATTYLWKAVGTYAMYWPQTPEWRTGRSPQRGRSRGARTPLLGP